MLAAKNDNSCVIQISPLYDLDENEQQSTSGKTLLAGDIGKAAERRLVERFGKALDSDLLLVPHHGSSSSSSLQFLHNVSPRVGLVSAGFNNRYNHPSSKIQQRYARLSIPLLRTDELGAVQYIFKNGEWLGPFCHRYVRRHFWIQRHGNAPEICVGSLRF